MADQQPAQLRITNASEAAQLVPYLVGFMPEESLVLVVSQQGRVQVTARIDLEAVQAPLTLEDLLDRIQSRYPDSNMTAFAYTGDHETGWNVLRRCDEWLPQGCQALMVDGDTWHLADGTTGVVDQFGSVAAQVTYHGLQRVPSRADLEARFASAPDSETLDRQLEAALAGLPAPHEKAKIVALTGDLIDRNLPREPGPDSGPRIAGDDAIQLSALVQNPTARDLAVLSIDHHNADRHLQLWQGVVNATPAHGADMALYLAGMAAWIGGDGVGANIALDRALHSEPPSTERHPAHLLDALIDNVVPPSAWDNLRGSILRQADPIVRAALSRPTLDASPRRESPPAVERTPEHRPEQMRRRPPAPGIAI